MKTTNKILVLGYLILLCSFISAQDNLQQVDATELFFLPDQVELGLDSTAFIELKVDPVSNAFSTAGEINYEPGKIKILQVLEGNLLNGDGVQTSFMQYNNQTDGRLYFGITRLGGQNGGITSTETKTIIKLLIKRIGTGYSTLNTQNFDILDSTSTSIGIFTTALLNIPELVFNQDSEIFFNPPSINLEVTETGWISLEIDSINGAFSCAGQLLYDKNKIQMMEVTQGNFFNSDGAQTSFVYTIDALNGKVFFGITRLGSQAGGISTDEPKSIINFRIKRLTFGTTPITTSEFAVLNNYGNPIGNFVNPTLNITNAVQLNSNVFFQPDNVALGVNDSSWIDFMIDSVTNVFSFSTILQYDPIRIRVAEIEEGNFLDQDGIQTEMVFTNDSIIGRITLGITRLGSNNPGVNTFDAKTIFRMHIKRVQPGNTNLISTQTGILDNMGNVIKMFDNQILNIIYPYGTDTPPTLHSPINGLLNVPVNVTFRWYKLNDPSYTYRIQVSKSSGFITTIIDQAGIDTFFIVSGLENNVRYYWRVNGTNDALVTTDWSAIWNFKTIVALPPIPVLYQPSNNALNLSITPTLKWYKSANAQFYDLEVFSDTNSYPIQAYYNLSDSLKILNALEYQTKYYWRVRAKNIAGTSSYSAFWNFTTKQSAPNPPALNQPPNGAGNIPYNVNLSWNPSQGADYYQLQASTSPAFYSTIVNQSGITATNYQVNGLGYYTWYYWKVRAYNESGWGAWSSIWSFRTVAAPPNQPALFSPTNNSQNVPLPVILIWQRTGGEVTFNLQVAVDSNFTSLVTNVSGITSTAYIDQNLVSNTQYYWRVTSVNPSGSSTSNTWKFKTKAYPDLIVEEILIPAEAYSGQTFQVDWRITNSGNGGTTPPTWYDAIYWSTEPTFNSQTAVLLGTALNISYLAPGEGYSNTATFNIPQSATGNRYIYVIADQYHNVSELNENNNMLRSTNPMNIILTPPPDLRVTSVITLGSAFSGTQISVDWTVRNFGTGPTLENYWTDRVYFSADSIFNINNSIALGNATHTGNLSPNQSYSNSTTITLPQAIYGKYYVYIFTDVTNRVFEYAAENNNTGRNDSIRVYLSPPPDFVVTQIVIPSEVGSGQQITVAWTVENQGPGAPFEGGWNDRVYLSSYNSFVVDSCQVLGTYSRSGPFPPGATYSQSKSVTVPNGLYGPKYIYVYTDCNNQVFEFNYENNNVTRSTSTINVKWFDLSALTLSNPSTASPGESIPINYSIKNLGPAGLINRNWVDGIYISKKNTFNPDSSILIKDVSQNRNLGIDSSYLVQQTAIVPGNTSGLYYVYLFADRTNQIFEHNNESNNIIQSPTQLMINSPDLIVTSIIPPTNANSGQQVSIQWGVTNQGSGSIINKSWSDRVYISKNNIFYQDSSHFLGSQVHSGTINPGGNYTKSGTFTLPDGISGNYFVFILADYTNVVGEANENNNTGVSSIPFNVQLSPWPDLRVNSVVVPGNATAGQQISVTWIVQNYGTIATQDSIWKDNIYISSNPNWDPNNSSLLKEVTRNGILTSGAYYQSVTSVTLPNNISGSQYIYVLTDAANDVFEYTDEGNNVRGSNQLNISSYPPVDLVISNFLSPGSTNSGESINVEFKVTNQSSVATLISSWPDAIYLSTDNVLNQTSDILLNSIPRTGNLAAGNSYTRNSNVTIPNGLSGQHYLIAITDKDNLNNDNNFLNNIIVAVVNISLTPSPDLIITSFDAPVVMNVGQPISLNWQVNNNGMGATVGGLWYDKVYISQDTLIDISDPVLGNVEHTGNLNPSQFYTANNQSFNTSSNLIEGNYFVLLKTDSRNEIYEHNAEYNNTRYSQITVLVPPPTDLIVENIVIPDTAVSGELVEVSWTLRNIGVNPAVGWIDDAVYFSTDSIWNIEDKILGISKRYVNISAGDAMRLIQVIDVAKTLELDEDGNLANILPGLVNGDYKVIVRTNIRNSLNESDITNNRGVSENNTYVDVPTITLGELYTTNLNHDQRKYFKVEVSADQDLRFTLTSDNQFSVNEIYLAYSRTPDVNDYDYASFEPFEANQEVLYPETLAGTYYLLVIGRSVPGNIEEISILGEALGFSMISINPPSGGSSGRVTTKIRGAGFADSLFFYLRSTSLDTVCIGKVVERKNRSEVSVKWELIDVPLGIYDVCLTKNDSIFTFLPQIFDVQPKITNQFYSNIVSPSNLIRGRDASYQLFVTNSNNVDADLVIFSVVFPSTVKTTIITQDFFGRPVSQEYIDSNPGISAGMKLGDYGIIIGYAKNVSVGTNLSATIKFENLNSPGNQFPAIINVFGLSQSQFILREGMILSVLRDSILNNPSFYDPILVQQIQEDNSFDYYKRGLFESGLIGDGPVYYPTLPLSYNPNNASMNQLSLTCDNVVSGIGIVLGGVGVVTSAVALFPVVGVGGAAILVGAGVVSLISSSVALGCEMYDEDECVLAAGTTAAAATGADTFTQLLLLAGGNGFNPLGLAGFFTDLFSSPICDFIMTLVSRDPNDIIGPRGFEELKWMARFYPFDYLIRFENDSILATAPAQIVNITQKLDSTLDSRTFRLGSFGFNNLIFNVPQNSSFYSKRLDLRDSIGVYVDVNAGIDVTTNKVFWTLKTIDPATGQVPLNPLIGFLPINDSTQAGEGFVNYTIYPKNTLQSGDIISAQANIIFDNNDPIETPIYTNMIDAGIPVSRVHQLPLSIDSTDIWVNWSGEDDSLGCGIGSYTIYVSENDGDYTEWLSNTTDNAAIFNGIDGHNYKFFSIAKDNVGNIENMKTTPEAEVTVGNVAIRLRPSWNLISWNKITESDSIRIVFGDIINNLEVALGFDGVGLTFDPEVEDIYNNLLTVNNKSGYWLKMNAEDYLLFDGERVNSQTPINLRAGWNLVSYLPAYSDSVRHALASILNKVIIVQAFDGNALTFNPSLNDSLNTLKMMSPNYGYWIKMNAADTLIYSDPPWQNKYLPTNLAVVNELLEPDSLVKPTNEWVSIYASEITVNKIPLPIGTEVTVKDPSGVICGKGSVEFAGMIPLIPIFRDDPFTEDVDEGASPGDIVRIYLNDLLVPVEITWQGNGQIINLTDIITNISGDLDGLIPTTFDISQNYPNPFNPTTTIKYQVPKVEKVTIEVYNILGERVKTLVNEVKDPGYYETKWNSFNDNNRQVASGVYIYRLRAGDFEKSKKMIILK